MLNLRNSGGDSLRFWRCHVIILLAGALFYSPSWAATPEKSRLNMEELENFKFDIDIENELKLMSSASSFGGVAASSSDEQQSQHDNVIAIRSANGQAYECTLPGLPIESRLDGDHSDDDDDDNEDQTAGAKSGGASSSRENQHSHYNFTLIGAKLADYLDELNRSSSSGGACLYRNQGWWTYEFCFSRHAAQYHQVGNGSILGEKISLGNFSHDFNWSEANITNSFPSAAAGVLYHEQYFEDGSVCELNQKRRRTVVKIFCSENEKAHIELISEVETCVYEIHVQSSAVCHIPHFSKKAKHFDIKCSPLVSKPLFDRYTERRQRELERKQQRKEEILRLESQMEESSTDETPLSVLDTAELLRDFMMMDSHLFSPVTTPASSNADPNQPTTAATASAEEDKKPEKAEEQQSVSGSGSRSSNDDATRADISFQAEQRENSISKLKENAKKIEKLFAMQIEPTHDSAPSTVDDESRSNKPLLSVLNEKQAGTASSSNDELIETLSERLNKLIDEIEIEEKETGENAGKTPAATSASDLDASDSLAPSAAPSTLTIDESNAAAETSADVNTEAAADADKSFSMHDSLLNSATESNEHIKQLEKQIAKKLSESSSGQFQSNNIKVKIITFDATQRELKGLSGSDNADGLNTLLAAMLESERQSAKLKTLADNYNALYDDKTVDDSFADDEKTEDPVKKGSDSIEPTEKLIIY